MQNVVSMKGTRGGLLVSFNEEEDYLAVITQFREMIEEKKKFFEGSPMSIDLGWREMTRENIEELMEVFRVNDLILQGLISSSATTRKIAEEYNIKVIIGRLGLAQHHGAKNKKIYYQKSQEKEEEREQTLLVRRTMRSGQNVDFEGNVVVMGDVNPGAEIIAAGDIIVWGSIRGSVWAGSKGNRKAKIIARELNPSKLKIDEYVYMGIIGDLKGNSKTAFLIEEDIAIESY